MAAGFLESLGRSGALREATTDITNLALNIRKVKSEEAVNAARLEEFNLNKRKIEGELKVREQEEQRFNRAIPLSVVRSQIPNQEAAAYAEKVAQSMGLIEEGEAEPTIKAGYVNEMYKLLHEPYHAENLSRIRIASAQKEWGSLATQVKEYSAGKTQEELAKDKKYGAMLQQAQAAQLNYIAATNDNKALMEFNKTVADNFEPKSWLEYMKTGDSNVLRTKPEKVTMSLMERGYNEKRQQPGFERLTLEEYKNKFWSPPTSKEGKDKSAAIQSKIDSLEKERFAAVNKGKFDNALLKALGMTTEDAKKPEGLDRYLKHIDTRIEKLHGELGGMPAGGASGASEGGKELTDEVVQRFLEENDYDLEKAEAAAKVAGYVF